MLLAWFDAGGGGNPYDRNKGREAKREARMLEGERDRDEIDEQGKIAFALDGGVLCLKFAGVAQALSAWAEEKEAEAAQDQGRHVDGDREGVHFFVKHVGGKEGSSDRQKRKPRLA